MSLLRELAIAIPIFIVAMIIASQLVVVPTSSMTPTIVKGDMVVVEKTNILGLIDELNPENIKVGDIIVYAKNSSGTPELIIHRVVGINETGGQKYYIMKGDNNSIDDPAMVPNSAVIGESVNWNSKPITIPWVGNIFLWLKGVT
ncbi:MAG: signal peptidase I [Methanobacterium sp.]|jgi:signal peptidase